MTIIVGDGIFVSLPRRCVTSEVARCTFLYHYLPALFYAFLSIANVLDAIPSLRVQRIVSFILILSVFIAFLTWRSWIYATPIILDKHASLQLYGPQWA